MTRQNGGSDLGKSCEYLEIENRPEDVAETNLEAVLVGGSGLLEQLFLLPLYLDQEDDRN